MVQRSNKYFAPNLGLNKEDIGATNDEVTRQLRHLQDSISSVFDGEAAHTRWIEVTADYTITADDIGRHIYVDTTAGDVTITLTDIGGENFYCWITHVYNTGNQVLIAADNTINDQTDTKLSGRHHTIGVFWHDLEYWLILENSHQVVRFDDPPVFDLDANVTQGSFQTIGATGSGATDIWSEMDKIPKTARSVKIGVRLAASWNDTGTKRHYSRARLAGGASNDSGDTVCDGSYYTNANTVVVYGEKDVNWVNDQIELLYDFTASNGTPTPTAELVLLGYNH